MLILGTQAPGTGNAFLGSAHVWCIARIYQNTSIIFMEARIHSGPLCGCVLCPIHQQSPLISAVTVSCTGTFHPTAVQHSAQVTKWKKKETLALNMPDRPCAAGKRRQEIRVTTDKSFPSRRKMRAETGARRRRGRGAASRSPARFSRRSD